MILENQLVGLPPQFRRHMEEKIQSSLLKMLAVARGRSSKEEYELTLHREIANIKAIIDLAQSLHQPQAPETNANNEEPLEG